MTVRDLFLGSQGGTVSALLILLLLFLMFTMSVRLMLSRRKKAYFSLTFSIVLIAAQHALIVVLGDRPNLQSGGEDHYIVQGLQTVSFILMNVGLYQLYNTTKRKIAALAYIGVFIALALMALRYYAATKLLTDVKGLPVEQVHAFLNIWMDLYLYGLILFCFYFITHSVGQTKTYQIGLVVYFLTHSAEVLNSYVFDGTADGLRLAEHFFPVVYFFIIFLFIFERVLELMQAVYHSSITDGLTGLFNRRFFMRRLNQYVQSGIPVSVIFTDIDNFKKLNDTQGHQRGDEALRHVAAIVMEEAEGIGIPGRFGGEEIVMLITDEDVDPAEAAERARSRVEAEAGVTVSVGWSKYRKGITGETLLKQADEAMYYSKKNGKNRVTGYKHISTAKRASVTND
ncbi:GGDEF domain-containing protein [Paenibacillus thermotolerans]|uniref:GGDEF domain-containing protein n=1 Tax=Paenibacillus thermotolerans TaxID=3027807 RepID=UPI002367C4A9|nr:MULTISPECIES: GGDEF domain-containing protein [unclassified Paenibacillus]